MKARSSTHPSLSKALSSASNSMRSQRHSHAKGWPPPEHARDPGGLPTSLRRTSIYGRRIGSSRACGPRSRDTPEARPSTCWARHRFRWRPHSSRHGAKPSQLPTNGRSASRRLSSPCPRSSLAISSSGSSRLLEFVVPDLDYYRRFLVDKLLDLPIVREVRSNIAIQTVKANAPLPLRHLDAGRR